MTAGQAYLVKPSEDIVNPIFEYVRIKAVYPEYAGGYDFVGTYNPMPIDNTRTVYFLGSDGHLKLAKANTTMKGLRAYFKVASASSAQLMIQLDDEVITAIDEVEADPSESASEAVYSVNGTYMGTNLKALPQGVYIINGRKVVKK